MADGIPDMTAIARAAGRDARTPTPLPVIPTDYAMLEFRPTHGVFVVRMLCDEIPAGEAAEAAQQIDALGHIADRINRGGPGL
jgi:hypothetical protein